ncbi:MAG: CDP-alcohol phosphatidyltransferase family protein [Lachnospiraceae bacterium]|nr:CDP-alcohol phosphatidyltransferase family protein [Lachnospiraceae bacterium]
MIGFYDYTIVTTFLSLFSSMLGIFLTSQSNYKYAILCLALSGFCDMLDGKIARTKKDRSDEQKSFGIQLDSLCDIVCFGVFPAYFAYRNGMDRIFGIVILLFYVMNGVIRLAYYNVMEEKRQKETTENRKFYSGLPITSISIALPIFYLIGSQLEHKFYVLLIHICMTVVGTLFVVDFKVKKPNNAQLAVIVIVVALVVLSMLKLI